MERLAYRLKAGNLKNLKINKESLAEPGDHEVTVEVKAIGLNFADIYVIWGLYSATPEGEFVPGLEYSGVVIKTGKEVKELKPGDRVMGVTRFGAYTSHINSDQGYVLPLPEKWTFEEGAAYLVQGLTAYYGLRKLGDLQDGQTVLVHSAAGGVGILANRVAKKFNAFTIGTVGSSSKVEFCKKEGYDEVIVRDAQFQEKLLKSLDGRELNVVMECIGGKILKSSFDVMAPMGRMIVYGSARYTTPGNRPNYLRMFFQYLGRPKIDPQNMTNLNKSVMAFNLIWLYEKAGLMQSILMEMNDLNLKRPYIGHRFPFEELPQAIQLFQTGKTMGKVVVTL